MTSVDPATVAWLDQRSAALVADTSISVLVEAWRRETDLADADEDEREEWRLARLNTAMAIVAKARSGPLDAV